LLEVAHQVLKEVTPITGVLVEMVGADAVRGRMALKRQEQLTRARAEARRRDGADVLRDQLEDQE
jgi:hypothetical protein